MTERKKLFNRTVMLEKKTSVGDLFSTGMGADTPAHMEPGLMSARGNSGSRS